MESGERQRARKEGAAFDLNLSRGRRCEGESGERDTLLKHNNNKKNKTIPLHQMRKRSRTCF